MGPDPVIGLQNEASSLDEARRESTAYEYLCHLEEAKTWISECLCEDLPSAAEFEKTLPNGIYLAKVGHFCAPHVVPYDKIFDVDHEKWQASGLHFKHTENINYFLNAVKEIGLPEIFLPETTDIYERKNMPRAIFCLHALSLIMFKLGSAPKIQDLYGRVHFTDQEISIMQDELERTGVNKKMPQFKNLGGMLYNGEDGPGGDNRLNIDKHFVNLNVIIKSRDFDGLLTFLKHPLSGIRDVSSTNIRQYMLVLNSELSRNFTQAEVQGLISRTNLLCALETVKSEVLAEDSFALLDALRNPFLQLSHLVVDSNAEMYLTNLLDYVEDMPEHNVLQKATIYEAILMANQLETEKNSLEHAIVSVNIALRNRSVPEILTSLRHQALHIPKVYTEAGDLYFSSLKLIQDESGADLNYDGIFKPVCFLNLVAEVGLAARKRDSNLVQEALANPELYIQDLEKKCMEKYSEAIMQQSSKSSELLSHGDIQDIVDRVNNDNSDYLHTLHGVEKVNSAVEKGGLGLSSAMLTLGYKLNKNDEIRLYSELLHLRNNKSRIEESEMSLWLEDIQQAYNTLQELKIEAISVAGALKGVNNAIEYKDAIGVISYLFNNWQLFRLNSRPERKDGEAILTALERKLQDRKDASHSWVIHFFEDGSNVYIDVENGSLSWTAPHCAGEGAALSVAEIRETVDEVADGLGLFFQEKFVRFQARIRGYLVRQRFFDMLDWYDRHTGQIIKIQAVWRGRRARRQLMNQLEEDIRERTKALRFLGQLGDAKSIEKHAIVIQRAWRAHKLRFNWQKILDSGFADLATVVKHIHLLDIKTKDAQEELDLARAKGELTQLLRNNEKLEDEVDEMDKKIGLLVQNRITVQEVIAEKKKGLTLHRSKSETGSQTMTGTQRGLKALIKESQDRLKAYQHMFYLLQTDPNYVARLMFVSPAPKPKFIETLIFTLYNFGGNRREEYLILKLFRTALHHEIQTKVTSLEEIVKNTPLVLKLVVNYNRYHRNHTLRRLLSPLIQMVMEDKHLKINTGPVDVYKSWISQIESETGSPAGMPYEVTPEVALEYEEVQKRLERSINSLKRYTKLFLASMIKTKLPYSILYMAKVLYSCLVDKFPESKEKDVLKIVGNLIYYKYMNPVIISPDRFDMLERKDITLTNEQRRNLAHIAKLLQYSSSKIGFGADNPHMENVNEFIIECHEKLKDYYARCCNVEEPEVEYNIDQYTDAALIAKPNIYISLAEITDTHALLMEHEDTVIPTKADLMHGILKTLGPASLSSLHGAATEDCGSLSALGRTEVCLVLNPVGGTKMGKDMTTTDRLWVKTKHLLFAILPSVHSSDKQNLIGLLKSRTTVEQEELYNEILDVKEQEFQASKHKDLEVFDIFCDDEGRLPLEDAKRLVLKNLRILEVEKYTSSKDGCQSIITDIAKDIFNQREHRLNRRRDLARMRRTKGDLLKKKNYMLDQLEKYRQYTLQCLANMNKAGNNKRVHFATLQDERSDSKGRKIRNKAAIKYSATKLFDKGVLYTIQGLPDSQLKNVQFVFVPLEEEGNFQISARFMGVDMESVRVDIQDLLKLQYEGVSVTDMFGKAKINVNLLLYFLNTKFYGR